MLRTTTTNVKQFFTPILTLFIATIMSFRTGYAPILYYDDWLTFGQQYLFGGLELIDLTNRRPLLDTVAKILLGVFGLDVKALYYAHIFVIFLCAVMVFFLARRLFSGHRFLALPAALLFLVYPVDLTRMWLSMNYIWITYLMTLVVLYLMLDYAEKGGLWKPALALPLIIFPLGAYESSFGLVIAWSVLLAFFTRGISSRRRTMLLYPIGIGVLFVIWRFVIQPAIFHVHDPYIAMGFETDQSLIAKFLDRLSPIVPVFVNAWILPFSSLLGVSPRRMMVLVGAAIAAVGLLVLWVTREHGAFIRTGKTAPSDSANETSLYHPVNQLSRAEMQKESLQLLKPFSIGIVMFVAGFFPYILIVKPALDWFSSRANMFAIFGAALAASAGIALIGMWITRNRLQMRLIVLSAMVPFILMGITQQIWNQNEARLAWAEQKHFWRALFQAVPNLKDGTTLVVAMPYDNPKQPYGRLPYIAEWELTAGLKVLYNNPTLKAIPYTPNHSEGIGYGHLEPEGVFSYTTGVTPYDQVVLVYYIQGSYEVKIVEQLNAEFPLDFAVEGYAPEKHLLPNPPPSTPYRGLVLQ